MFCGHCGQKKLLSEHRFCENCGKPFDSQENHHLENLGIQDEPPPSHKPPKPPPGIQIKTGDEENYDADILSVAAGKTKDIIDLYQRFLLEYMLMAREENQVSRD